MECCTEDPLVTDYKIRTARLEFELAEKMNRPSYIFKPKLTFNLERRRSAAWLAGFGESIDGESATHSYGVYAYGATPELAYVAFDKEWVRKYGV